MIIKIYGGRIEKVKKGRGVMLMIQSKVKVINIEYGKKKSRIDKCPDQDKIWINPKNNSCICTTKNKKIGLRT